MCRKWGRIANFLGGVSFCIKEGRQGGSQGNKGKFNAGGGSKQKAAKSHPHRRGQQGEADENPQEGTCKLPRL